jgi:peptidoglycan/xylan/chitin deacetylase (PgdA/CDA1 family)
MMGIVQLFRGHVVLATIALSCAVVPSACSSTNASESDSPSGEVDDSLTGFARRNIEVESGALDTIDPITGAKKPIVLSGKKISLTFDCMWPRLLGSNNSMVLAQTLKDKNVRTTIFIAGACVFDDEAFRLRDVLSGATAVSDALRARRPGAQNVSFRTLIKLLVDSGHEFGNHSVRHIINTPEASQNWQREMEVLRTGWEATMLELYGANWRIERPNAVMKPYWRAPGGDFGSAKNHPETLLAAAKGGHNQHFLWHLDTRDSVAGAPVGVTAAAWKADGNSQAVDLNGRRLDAGQMSQAVLDAADGRPTIVLGHLANAFHWENPAFWQAKGGVKTPQLSLGDVIDKLRAKGYAVTTISDMMGIGGDPNVISGKNPVRGITCNTQGGCVWSGDCASSQAYTKRFVDAAGAKFVCKKTGNGGCDGSAINAECTVL